jgi:DNA sulfur modification protein DndB
MKAIPDDYTINGLVCGDDFKHVVSNRKKTYDKIKTIEKDKLPEFENDGWIKTKTQNKSKSGLIKIEKSKSVGTLFEDEIWTLFYNMGFSELNGKSVDFRIPRCESGVAKQIDVFARDEQTVCIVQCKAAEKEMILSSSRRDVRTEINEMIEMSGQISTSIYTHYNNINKNLDKPRMNINIIWVLALKNITLSDTDKALIEGASIKIITLDTALIAYYQTLAKELGSAAKYIFLGELMPGRRLPGLTGGSISAIKGKMGDKQFYSFLIEPERLLKISYLSHREKASDGVSYTYQRMADKSRINKIRSYIQNKPDGSKLGGGIFPTSIVINIQAGTKDGFKFEPESGMKNENAVFGNLYLPDVYHSAWVIDGQHRLYAYSGLEEAKTATLPVIAFENLDVVYQAQLFCDINGKQKTVTKNLINSLKATIDKDSPIAKVNLDSRCATVGILLNTDPKSMFYKHISETSARGKDITLTTITNEIYKTKMLGTASSSSKIGDPNPGPLTKDDFDSTCQHAKDVIIGYYNLFLENKTLQSQWNLKDQGFINANNGITSTLRLLGVILNTLRSFDPDINTRNSKKVISDIKIYVEPVVNHLADASQIEISMLRKNSGEGGFNENLHFFQTIINKVYPELYLKEATKYREEHQEGNKENSVKCFELCSSLERMIRSNVIKILKGKFGQSVQQWWAEGVPSNTREAAEKLARENKDYSQKYEQWLTLIQLKIIIETNWSTFKDLDIYTIDKNYSESKDKQLGWFIKFNNIRNKQSHTKYITDDELQFIINIYNVLEPKLKDIEGV